MPIPDYESDVMNVLMRNVDTPTLTRLAASSRTLFEKAKNFRREIDHMTIFMHDHLELRMTANHHTVISWTVDSLKPDNIMKDHIMKIGDNVFLTSIRESCSVYEEYDLHSYCDFPSAWLDIVGFIFDIFSPKQLIVRYSHEDSFYRMQEILRWDRLNEVDNLMFFHFLQMRISTLVLMANNLNPKKSLHVQTLKTDGQAHVFECNRVFTMDTLHWFAPTPWFKARDLLQTTSKAIKVMSEFTFEELNTFIKQWMRKEREVRQLLCDHSGDVSEQTALYKDLTPLRYKEFKCLNGLGSHDIVMKFENSDPSCSGHAAKFIERADGEYGAVFVGKHTFGFAVVSLRNTRLVSNLAKEDRPAAFPFPDI